MNDNIFTIEIIVGIALILLDFFLLKTPGLQAAFFGTFVVFFSVMFGFLYLGYQSIEPYKTKTVAKK